MALHTPAQDPRRLSFSPNPVSSFANPLQSPYTPNPSLRPSVASNYTSLHRPSVHNASPDGPQQPSEEAEAFISGGLQSELRAIALRAVSVARTSLLTREPSALGINYASQILQELTSQLQLSSSLLAAPTIRPSTRNQISILNAHLRLEHDVWTLLKSSWTLPQTGTDDMLTRRLNLPTTELLQVSHIEGVCKVQTVLKWLEERASNQLQASGGPLVNPLDDPAYRWAYTSSRYGKGPVSMDFPVRVADDNPLDEVDRKADARLAREVFRLIRAGQIDEAERVCRDAGQPWRAAALAGGKNAADLCANGVSGSARASWRKAAAALANSGNIAIPLHERAVCAVLAGILQPVLAVCPTYDDQLWARLSYLLDSTLDRVLSEGQDAVIDDGAIKQTFFECEFASEGIDTVPPEILNAVRRLEAYISLGPEMSAEDCSSLMETLASLAEKGMHHRVEWACRLASQIALFMKYSGEVGNTSEKDDLLRSFDSTVNQFVELVIRSDADADDDPFQRRSFEERAAVCSIAANFLAELGDIRDGISVYSKMMHAALRGDLMQEEEESERAKVAAQSVEERRVVCLQEAVQCFSPSVVTELMVATVNDVWRDNFEIGPGESRLSLGEPRFGGGLRDREPDKDEMVIRAIEFLTFSESPNYEEALVRTTCAARRFFLLSKRETARRLIAWFPPEVIQFVSKENCGGFLREFQHWEVYFKAVASYNEWYKFKSGSRPIPLEDSVRRAALSRPIQREARRKLEEYEQGFREYEETCVRLRAEAAHELNDALLGEKGWMSEVLNSSSELTEDASKILVDETERQEELEAVRRVGIPELVSLMHSVLDKSGLYEEAVHMATLVALEEHRLYNHFDPASMKAFLAKVADSAVKMADELVRSEDLSHPYKDTYFEDFGAVVDSQRVTFAEQ